MTDAIEAPAAETPQVPAFTPPPPPKFKYFRDDAVAPVKPRPRLGAINRFEEVRVLWACKVPTDDVEELLRPDFWRIVAPRLSRNDIILALAESEGWEIEARVERVLPDGVEISVQKKMKRTSQGGNSTILGNGAFRTEFRQGSWHVFRVKDDYPVIRGHSTETAAIHAWAITQPRRA